MKRLCFFAAAALILGAWGCAPRYSHPEKPESLWEMDYDMCVVDADYAVAYRDYTYGEPRPESYCSREYREFIRNCMEQKGYSFADDPDTSAQDNAGS